MKALFSKKETGFLFYFHIALFDFLFYNLIDNNC